MRRFVFIIFICCSLFSLAQKTPRVFKKFTDTIFNVGDGILAPAIYWDLGPAGINPNSLDSITIIARFLKSHSNFKVEIGSHTDSRGKDKANVLLSAARAQSIVDYLVKELRISPEKVIAKGYGKTQLLISDEQILKAKTKEQKEELHQKNRRTEIKILLIEYRTLTDTIFNIGDKIAIPEIIYSLGSCDILPQSKDSAKVIAEFMKKHPNFKIEVGCHTDSRGKAESNIILSQCRANSVMDFLTKEMMLPPEKISAKGYGSKEPVVKADEILKAKTRQEKEPLYKKNRRTELKIIAIK